MRSARLRAQGYESIRRVMSLHPLLKQQFEDARQDSGTGRLDLRRLLHAISGAYSEWDEERRGVVRSMRLLADETTAFTREVRESAAAQLQAILDHVKDAILTVDETGRIETLNTTGERLFGYAEIDVRGQKLDVLIPSLARHPRIIESLEELSESVDDTQADLAPRETKGRRRNGLLFDAEIGVSRIRLDRKEVFIVCLRETTDRKAAEAAIRESEARYRTLVEHAPEAIVVLDMDANRFVECNENAVRFFKMTREELLASGPEAISPPLQADGTPSFGIARGHMDRALAGDAPTFEWLHRDALGHDIPCEVRLVRLPSSGRRLIRGSITDITERKRMEVLAAGERRVFERVTGHADLNATLEAITETAEKVTADAICTISVFVVDTNELQHVAGLRLPDVFLHANRRLEVGPRNGSCAAAIFLQRQVIVAEISRDALWEFKREPAIEAGLRACWSTPIRASDGRMLGTVALYFREPRSPLRRDFELMSRLTALAAIAIERKRSEDALRRSEAQYRSLFENVIEGVYRSTVEGRFEAVNPALVEMLGYASIDDVLAIARTGDVYANEAERAQILADLHRDGVVRQAESQLRRLDGTLVTVVENARVIRNAQGDITGYEGTITDVTVRKRAEVQLYEEKEKAQVTLQSIGDAVITVDADGRVEYLNAVAEELTGWETCEAAGRPVTEVFQVLSESTRQQVDSPILRCLREGRVVDTAEHSLLINRRGQEISIQDSAAPIRDRTGRLIGVVMVFHDVSQERRLQRALAYQATHDVLTGLINRRAFEQRLSETLQLARSEASVSHVLMYLDLDQFKVVNDTCGHQAGDRLLKQITSVVQTRIRGTDTLARLGGDEFGVLLEDCPLATAQGIAESLRQAIRDFRFVWEDRVLNVGVSIGLAELNGEVDTLDTIMSAADVACYSAKESGRNRVQTYRQGRAPERHREMQWVSRINRACEEDRLVLMCQPIVPIRAVVDPLRHFELLLRMRDENGQLVQPAEFIPAAERFNLMPTIDRWVVRQACMHLAHRRGDDGKRPPFTLAINVSPTTINDEQFLDFVLQQMTEGDVSPGALCFELTETAAMTSLAASTHFIRELRARGCRFSLDDFGSGLSSFMFLKNLPVDFVKIDGQFVHNVTHDAIDRSMVEAITQIAGTMGIPTIAERVDSAEVLQQLAEIGVQYAQGHYVASPQPVEVLSTLIVTAPANPAAIGETERQFG
jgi:diguanylate cyclase (GGDEF)-like protein/PAS domain S-box-containing protein